MTTTVADQVFERVSALMAGGASRAEAIRRVAEEMDRSITATSSAYTAGARRAAEEGEPARAVARTDAPRLYAEMLPLVEAGATVEQAARRFGDDDAVAEIAAGFSRWARREAGDALEAADEGDAAAELAEAQDRIEELEAEVRRLRHDLARAKQTLTRARVIIDAGLGETGT